VAKREDGKETRRRLLNAACEVFAEKGYRNAKVVEICKRAGANVASVNYYFRDKANLYAEIWRYTFRQFEEPLFSALADGSPQEQLRTYILNLMKNFTQKGDAGHFSRLYLMEIANPTGLIKNDWRELIDPQRRKLHHIIRELLGHNADDQRVVFCELSIVSQCRTLLTIKRSDLEYLLGQSFGPELIKRLADHIADFSLAGIKAVGNVIKA
jgi:TetR/AcrR family transcriptional regulator, regulator of cefoperazone and chloramphenicol sensitivity